MMRVQTVVKETLSSPGSKLDSRLSEDEMKGNPAGPGGPLMRKPTWSNAPGCSAKSAFFAYVDTTRCSGPGPRRWLPVVQRFLSAVRSAELGRFRIPRIGPFDLRGGNHGYTKFPRKSDAGPGPPQDGGPDAVAGRSHDELPCAVAAARRVVAGHRSPAGCRCPTRRGGTPAGSGSASRKGKGVITE